MPGAREGATEKKVPGAREGAAEGDAAVVDDVRRVRVRRRELLPARALLGARVLLGWAACRPGRRILPQSVHTHTQAITV